MFDPPLELSIADAKAAEVLCRQILSASQSDDVILVDAQGRLLCWTGLTQRLDTMALGALAAASVAAEQGLAQLIGEKCFDHVLHRGAQKSLFLASVSPVAVLIVLFDSLIPCEKVQDAVKGVYDQIFALVMACKSQTPSHAAALIDVSEQDIDNLFR